MHLVLLHLPLCYDPEQMQFEIDLLAYLRLPLAFSTFVKILKFEIDLLAYLRLPLAFSTFVKILKQTFSRHIGRNCLMFVASFCFGSSKIIA
jgi:hypothetical protein